MKNTCIKHQIVAALLLVTSLTFGQTLPDFFTKSDAFFKAHVNNGKINYKAIHQNDAALQELVSLMKNVSVSVSDTHNYRAFWINSYNLTVIKSVINNYPLKSPLDVAGFFDKTKHAIASQQLTLNDIEHKMLRAKFKNDPRFHFVLVCAGLGCPPIINSAYLPTTLEKQLNNQTKKAVNNASFIKVSKKKVAISQIFKWYTTDFTQGGQSIVDFLNTYRNTAIPAKSKVSYYEYDWRLNAL